MINVVYIEAKEGVPDCGPVSEEKGRFVVGEEDGDWTRNAPVCGVRVLMVLEIENCSSDAYILNENGRYFFTWSFFLSTYYPKNLKD